MTTQLVVLCPKCGCDAMAETRSIKPSDLPPLDEIPDLPSPANTKRVFTCSNCGTKFERSDDQDDTVWISGDSIVQTQVPRTKCPRCGCTEMWESIQKETPIKTRWYGVRYLATSVDFKWIHICIRCKKRFEQPS